VSKPSENVLLVPGEDGWEIWTGEAATGFTFQSATGLGRAGDIPNLPAGELIMLFPVKSLTALPMQAPGNDESLFPDLAAMHAERLGLRPDPMSGQLTDIFVVSGTAEQTCLLSVILRNPSDGDLPTRGPKEFDLSARALPLAGDALTVWREFGRWVFAISQGGNLVYCQATACTSPAPDHALVREIRLAMIQLSLQGIDLRPSRVVLWTAAAEAGPAALNGAFSAPVEVAPRPAPVLPATRSKLLPADVRAARREALRRRNTRAAAAAVALAYLGLTGWFGFGLWQDSSTTTRLKAQAAAAAPEGREYQEHIEKWAELANAIDLNYSPVDILSRVHRSIPINSGLRLRTAEINAGEIKLIGEAPQLPAVNQFNRNLKQNNDLARFEWQTPEPQQTNRGWEFVYTANLPQS
jgi:hypothetical protein